jgi:hypothetical protein
MFRAAHRSSSGALPVFAASGLHKHVVTGRSQVRVGTQTFLRPVTTCVCKTGSDVTNQTGSDVTNQTTPLVYEKSKFHYRISKTCHWS